MSKEGSYVSIVKDGILQWLESVRYPDEGWGRWKYNSDMSRPWALNASGLAICVLDRLDALKDIPESQKQEAVKFFQSCQDPKDLLFKDHLEDESCHVGPHTWPQIWGQRHSAALMALDLLNAEPLYPLPEVQFVDLNKISPREWMMSLDWSNPWMHGESWYRTIMAFSNAQPEKIDDKHPILAELFETMESEIIDPETGTPMKLGCEDKSVAMAGLFKIMFGYIFAGRPYPYAEKGLDFTLALQQSNGEFGRNMCLNWDALWILYQLDIQLKGSYRHSDVVKAGEKTCDVLMDEYRKDDGGFAFHGDHCQVNHHSIQLSEKELPISDMLGTKMSLTCLEYLDEWKGL